MQSTGDHLGREFQLPLATRLGVLAIVSLAVTVIVMDGSIVNVALPTLARTLEGASNSELQWIVDAYILSFASLLLTCGSAADRFGRKRLLLLGLLVFGVMSVGAALAGNARELIVWRALMGIGAAMIFPATLAILSHAFVDPKERSRAIAVWAGSSGIGVAIGPVAGGWLLNHYEWGSIFLVNLPVVALTGIGGWILIRESRDPYPSRLDWLGNLLAVGWITALVYGLIEGPVLGWDRSRIVVILLSAVLLAFVFVLWELRSESPMLDVRVFSSKAFAAACLAITLAFFGLFGFVFMVTQYLQFVHEYDALEAGLRTLPFAGYILLGAAMAATVAANPYRSAFVVFGLLLMASGFAWVTSDNEQTGYMQLVWQMGLLGVGLGLVNAIATEMIMNSLPPERTGIGSSVNDTTRELGGTLGVAAMGSVFNLVYRADIDSVFAGRPIPERATDAIRESVGMASVVIDQVRDAAGDIAADLTRGKVVESFLHGFHASSWLACASVALGAIGVLAISAQRRTDRSPMNTSEHLALAEEGANNAY